MINDDQIKAYVEGRLDERECSRLEQAMGLDDALNARLNTLLEQPDLAQAVLHQAYIPDATEGQLATAWNAAAADESSSSLHDVIPTVDQKVSLEDSRVVDNVSSSWWLRPFRVMCSISLLVAAVVFGAVYQEQVERVLSPYGLMASKASSSTQDSFWLGDNIEPNQALFRMLEHTPSYEFFYSAKGDDLMVPVLSFQASDGRYCREFEVNAGTSVSIGVACRQAQHWVVEVLLAAGQRPDGQRAYQAASGFSHNAMNAVLDRLWSGVALNAEQEMQTIARHWDSTAL